MIGVTANAACSIALRNAVFKGVPKAFWSTAYEAVRRVVAGDPNTLAKRRSDALTYLEKQGVGCARVVAALGVAGVDDIGLDQIVTLRGRVAAIRNEEITLEEAFPDPNKVAKPAVESKPTKGVAGLKAKVAKEKSGGEGDDELERAAKAAGHGEVAGA